MFLWKVKLESDMLKGAKCCLFEVRSARKKTREHSALQNHLSGGRQSPGVRKEASVQVQGWGKICWLQTVKAISPLQNILAGILEKSETLSNYTSSLKLRNRTQKLTSGASGRLCRRSPDWRCASWTHGNWSLHSLALCSIYKKEKKKSDFLKKVSQQNGSLVI